jgi:hypothetical protein
MNNKDSENRLVGSQRRISLLSKEEKMDKSIDGYDNLDIYSK